MRQKLTPSNRTFTVNGVRIRDIGRFCLQPDEMVSLQHPDGPACDITAKSWGYYLGPSLNGRLKAEGFKTALVVNGANKVFVMAVLAGRMADFTAYLESQNGLRVVCWLDEWLPAVPGGNAP